jgi:hypothetical protein
MAFFFRLHIPVPGDLDSPSKLGCTQTDSSWRLPVGPEARARAGREGLWGSDAWAGGLPLSRVRSILSNGSVARDG